MARLLLDTHIALWAISDDARLTAPARALIADPGNDIHVSAASVWEIAIKHGLGPDRAGAMPISGGQAAVFFAEAGYLTLPITAAHAAAVDDLPPHHSDPIDRILIAQALVEPMRLITHDRALAAYSDLVEAV